MSLDALLSKVTTQGKDQSVAGGGGDFAPPEKGTTGARLVGYFETGKHEEEWEKVKKTVDKVELVFELIGKKHPPREVNGENIPVRMTVILTLSQFQNSGFFKLFSKLREDGDKHFVQLLGRAFMVDVEHKEKEIGGKKRVYANINKGTIRKPFITLPSDPNDPESELVEKPYPVGAALTELKAFVWDFADAAMWDSIFIPGEYPERKDEKTGEVTAPAKSKNVLQQKIASALNFKGLPCYDYAASRLAGDGKVTKEDTSALADAVGDVANAPAPDSDDPMAGIG